MSGGARSARLYERSSIALRRSSLTCADVLPQLVDRLAHVLVVQVVGYRAGPVVAEELFEPHARVRLGGIADLRARRDAAAVDRDDELHRQVVVVADLLERRDDPGPVDRALPARHAVVVGDVEGVELV